MFQTAARPLLLKLAIALVAAGVCGRGVNAHEMDAHAWTAGNTPASEKIYWLHGRINDVSEQNGLVNVTHDPVKELSWPSMTMTFHVSDKALFSKLHAHDSIDFALKEVTGNHYEIVDVKDHN